MKKVTTQEAADKLKMTRLTVQVLLRENRLPIGTAVKNPGSSKYHYIIYEELLDAYIKSIESGDFLKTSQCLIGGEYEGENNTLFQA